MLIKISVNVRKFLNGSVLFQVAVVTVAFPATPLLLARARICISASHSREDLVTALQVCSLNFIQWVNFSKKCIIKWL